MRKISVVIIAGSLMGVAFISWIQDDAVRYNNLRVLPKNITTKELNGIMVDEFNDGLGVSCTFCHAEDKHTRQPDYASDEKPEKQIARKMMKMTLRLNEKYFNEKHPSLAKTGSVITCNTCHNGKPQPLAEE
jgi:hypothetical protein